MEIPNGEKPPRLKAGERGSNWGKESIDNFQKAQQNLCRGGKKASTAFARLNTDQNSRRLRGKGKVSGDRTCFIDTPATGGVISHQEKGEQQAGKTHITEIGWKQKTSRSTSQGIGVFHRPEFWSSCGLGKEKNSEKESKRKKGKASSASQPDI